MPFGLNQMRSELYFRGGKQLLLIKARIDCPLEGALMKIAQVCFLSSFP